MTPDEKSISVVLTAPEKWKKNPEESSISMQQIYPNLKYNVSIYNTKSNRTVSLRWVGGTWSVSLFTVSAGASEALLLCM